MSTHAQNNDWSTQNQNRNSNWGNNNSRQYSFRGANYNSNNSNTNQFKNSNHVNSNMNNPPPGATSSNSKNTYAQAMMNKNFKTTTSLMNEDTTDMKEHSRVYKMKTLPPIGFQAYAKKIFPSMDVCNVAQIEHNGVFMPALTLHFSGESAKKDYESAGEFTINIGRVPLTLKAIDKDTETDGHGNVIPRIVKTIFAKSVPKALADHPEIIETALKEYVKIEKDKIIQCKINGIYSGNIIIPVVEYKVLPKMFFPMPYIAWSVTENKWTQQGTTKCKVELRCRGFDASNSLLFKEVQAEKAKPKACKICKATTHWASKCPRKKPSSCPHCGSTNGECKRGECANFVTMMDGDFETKQFLNPVMVARLENDRRKEYSEFESKSSLFSYKRDGNGKNKSRRRQMVNGSIYANQNSLTVPNVHVSVPTSNRYTNLGNEDEAGIEQEDKKNPETANVEANEVKDNDEKNSDHGEDDEEEKDEGDADTNNVITKNVVIENSAEGEKEEMSVDDEHNDEGGDDNLNSNISLTENNQNENLENDKNDNPPNDGGAGDGK